MAAVYGSFNCSNNSKKGLLALWTLKNPYYPEAFLETDSPILSVKFSKKHPNLFGCGFLDGSLSIFDTRQRLKRPVVTS